MRRITIATRSTGLIWQRTVNGIWKRIEWLENATSDKETVDNQTLVVSNLDEQQIDCNNP